MGDIEGALGMYQSRGVLVVPIQTEIYDETIAQIKNQIAHHVHASKIYGVLIDVSSVNIIDSHLIEEFAAISKMVHLLGSVLVVSGIKPGIAMTLSELDADISGLRTVLDMEQGFVYLEKIQLEKSIDFTEDENEKEADDEEVSSGDEAVKEENKLEGEIPEENG